MVKLRSAVPSKVQDVDGGAMLLDGERAVRAVLKAMEQRAEAAEALVEKQAFLLADLRRQLRGWFGERQWLVHVLAAHRHLRSLRSPPARRGS